MVRNKPEYLDAREATLLYNALKRGHIRPDDSVKPEVFNLIKKFAWELSEEEFVQYMTNPLEAPPVKLSGYEMQVLRGGAVRDSYYGFKRALDKMEEVVEKYFGNKT